MKEFQENTRDLLERLNTDGSVGLSTGQVDAQRERYGSNTLTKEKPESLLKRIAEAASEPMILMLIMAALQTDPGSAPISWRLRGLWI